MPRTKKVKTEPLTEQELEFLKRPPHNSLIRLTDGIGDDTDWYNVAFRVMASIKTAEFVYVQEVVKQLNDCYELLKLIYEREKDKTEKWCVSLQEYEQLYSALLAADEMQKEVDRPTQIYAYRKTHAKLKYLVNRHNRERGLINHG